MERLERLRQLDREARMVHRIAAVLSWDQETYMPQGALEERAEQMAFLEGLAHDKAVSPEIGELLEASGSTAENPSGSESLPLTDRAYLRVLRRNYDMETRLPVELVTAMAKDTSLSQAAWVQARRNNDYASFAPHLRTMLGHATSVASCIRPEARPYDVLLDRHEPGSTVEGVRTVFDRLKIDLVRILDAIRSRPQVEDSVLKARVPVQAQTAASEYLMRTLSFDFERGRLDTTAHPFTTTLGSSDVRITTRYNETFFPTSVFGTMHETGHALYELGIDPSPDYRGTALADASSMGIHESQSRLWENTVGRSKAFWEGHLQTMGAWLGPDVTGIGLDAFYRAINKVEPSLIRVEADEVTYALHIILRFELEAAMTDGSLDVADLPAAWNDGMKRLLGVVPPDDASGCMQDIHWSIGLFGYFPSYALGNLYAAQWWQAMRDQGVDPDGAIMRGDLPAILAWLRVHIHQPGAIYTPGELVRKVSGSDLDPSHYIRYLENKYRAVYGY